MDGTSIIILSYNTLDLTRLCVESIRQYTQDVPHEIIIVDNGSKDGSVDWLKKQSDIRCIFNKDNAGFPKGCNQGLAIAKGSELLLLNSDTIVTPRWLSNLRTALYSRPEVGAVSCMTNNISNMQSMPVSYHDVPGLFAFAESFNHSDPSKWERRLTLVGFCFLFKREIYTKLGGLDEQFSPGNYEDDDYSLRIWQAGYELLVCRDTMIHHFGSASFVQSASPAVWEKERKAHKRLLDKNQEKFLQKWHVPENYKELGLKDVFPGWQGPEVVTCRELLDAERAAARRSGEKRAYRRKNKNLPLASIIMPCWNSGKHLRESVASALAQDYPKLELVIADDGSDDALTQEVLASLHDKRIRVLHLPHRGPSATRNAAIEAAQGTYILPLDSDDLIEPVYLSEAIAVLEQDRNVGMVYCRADLFDQQSGPWNTTDFDPDLMLVQNLIHVSAVFRKEDFLRAHGYDTNLGYWEDWDFWLSLMDLGLHPVRLEGTYFHYRKRSDSSSLTQQDFSREDMLKTYDTILQRHEKLYREHYRAVISLLRGQFFDWQIFGKRWKAIAEGRIGAEENRWVKLSRQMPWDKIEEQYDASFADLGGVEHPARFVLGTILLQAQLGCSDEEILNQLQENPYMRAFIGWDSNTIEFPDGFMDFAHRKVTEPMLQQVAKMLQE